jgi:dTDP-4-dehydrorhamnose reductase
MRYLLTGAGGQLGSAFRTRLEASSHVGVALTRAELDLTDAARILDVVTSARPDVVVNCAAYNAVDAAEDDAPGAFAVNAFAVLALARAAEAAGAALVHYSTDFVFDGSASEPYTETSATNPRSVYGQSKLTGEWMAFEAKRAYVLRVESLFGGPASRSSIDRIVASLRTGASTRVFVDRVVSPSYVEDVIDATLAVVSRDAAPGVYHCVNSGQATWRELGEFVADATGAPRTLLEPVRVADVAMRAPRPLYCALSNAKLAAAGIQMPSWQDALRRHLSHSGH